MVAISHVYLNSDVSIHFSDNQVVIKNEEEILKNIPIELLESVVIKGLTPISSKTILELLNRNIPVVYLDSKGKYLGGYISDNININHQRKQFKYSSNTKFSLELSKKIIVSKICNQRVVLNRYLKSNDDNKIHLSNVIGKINAAESIEQIRGYEGSIAKKYFEQISKIIKDDFSFKGRNRNPAKDPFNSLLNLGYTLLYNEVITAINIKKLNPYAGFMHEDKVGHATFASDLMEEWRPVIIDSLVLNLIQNNIIRMEHFYKNNENEGIFLNKEGYKIFISNYENKINTKTKYLKSIKYKLSFREAIIFKIQNLINIFDNNGDCELFEPFTLR